MELHFVAGGVNGSLQRQHHGDDWGGHVLPNIFQDRFFKSSKSEKKYLGGGGTMVAHEKNSSTDKQGNEKDFQQINKEMKNFIDKSLIKALLLPNGRGFHKKWAWC